MSKKELSIPVFQAVLKDEEDESTGIQAISFVKFPAIESMGVALSEKKEPIKFAADERKFTFTAPVLIPNKKIFREDEPGVPYYMVFSAQQIEKLRNKFMAQKLTDVTNINHQPKTLNDKSYIVETFIIQNQKMADAMIEIGLEALPIGTWVSTYKVGDIETYNMMLSSNLNGLSVEAFVGMELVKLSGIKPQININKQEKNMKKTNKLSQLFAELSALFLEENANGLVKYILEDGSIVEADASGKIVSPIGVADGEYALAPDQAVASITVKDGKIEPVAEAPAEATPAVPAASPEAAPAEASLADSGTTAPAPAQPSGSTEPAAAPEEKKEDAPVEQAKLKEVKSADGQVISIDEASKAVSIVGADGSLAPAPAGEYPLEDGSILIVGEDGKVLDVMSKLAAEKVQSLSAAVVELNGKVRELEIKLSKTPAITTPISTKKVDMSANNMDKLSVAQKAALAAKMRIKDKSR